MAASTAPSMLKCPDYRIRECTNTLVFAIQFPPRFLRFLVGLLPPYVMSQLCQDIPPYQIVCGPYFTFWSLYLTYLALPVPLRKSSISIESMMKKVFPRGYQLHDCMYQILRGGNINTTRPTLWGPTINSIYMVYIEIFQINHYYDAKGSSLVHSNTL